MHTFKAREMVQVFAVDKMKPSLDVRSLAFCFIADHLWFLSSIRDVKEALSSAPGTALSATVDRGASGK